MTDRNHPFHVRSFVRSFFRSIDRSTWRGACASLVDGGDVGRLTYVTTPREEGREGRGEGAGGGGRGEASIVNEEGRSESSSGQRVYIEEWITVYASIY